MRMDDGADEVLIQHELMSAAAQGLERGELSITGPSAVFELPTGRTLELDGGAVAERREIVVFAPSPPPGALGRVTGGLLSFTMDPLAVLGHHLARGAPSEAWLRRWSLGGGDPVQAAWRASVQPSAMAAVLAWSGAPAAPLVTMLHLSGVYDGPFWRRWVHQLAPEGPTLAAVIDGRARMQAAPRDGLADLLDVLDDPGGLEAWTRRWETPEVHAVARAWAASSYMPGMMWVLQNALPRARAHELALELGSRQLAGERIDVVAAMRAALPEPPPLDRLRARAAERAIEEDPFAE